MQFVCSFQSTVEMVDVIYSSEGNFFLMELTSVNDETVKLSAEHCSYLQSYLNGGDHVCESLI